jgi:arylsulfatase A-like enzyme
LFWDFNEQGGKRAVLKWPWKLIHLNTLGVAGKGKGKPKPLQTLLFNLDNDEGEQTNVADQNPEVLAELEPLLKSGWTDPQ